MAPNGGRLRLGVLAEPLAVCRLGCDDPIPGWAGKGGLISITRTGEELSIVCPQEQVPPEIRREGGWKALKVDGPLAFSQTGVLASLAGPLARAAISIFAISTYDTDYLLVKENRLQDAIDILIQEGHVLM